MSTAVPAIFDIRRHALDDGPGIRTVLFVKGCPLSCVWCHNPESMAVAPEIAFYGQHCIGCDDCSANCPVAAIESGVIDRSRCDSCGRCVEVCPTTALRKAGEFYSAEALGKELLKDRLFFETSGGGVTLSGGEPTMFAGFIGELACLLKAEGVHVALQTCGCFNLDSFCSLILPYIDLIYFDLKLADPKQHRHYTGCDNVEIITNFKALVGMPDVSVVARIPLVPEVTTTEGNLDQLAELLIASGCRNYELLPYHPGGLQKRQAFGLMTTRVPAARMLSLEEESYWRARFDARMKSP